MLKQLYHPGPILTSSIIFWVTLSTIYCTLMLWPPLSSWGSLLYFLTFIIFSSLTIFNYFSALAKGPGFLKRGWKPENPEDVNHLKYCNECQGYKAPRAHHCRTCGRCSMKMDHHCPWLNNCVGHFNHSSFVFFLVFAVLGSVQSCITLSISIFHSMNVPHYAKSGNSNQTLVILTAFSLIMVVIGLGLAILVVVGVGILLFLQIKSILKNQTYIEDHIINKANLRLEASKSSFTNPYDLGKWSNIKTIINPCNGIDWQIKPGFDKYHMTKEQILQKEEKKQRMKTFKVIKRYSGACCPVFSFGLKVITQYPYNDDPRLPLEPGSLVTVTRWKKHWLYGCLLIDNKISKKRGWFPRVCTDQDSKLMFKEKLN